VITIAPETAQTVSHRSIILYINNVEVFKIFGHYKVLGKTGSQRYTNEEVVAVRKANGLNSFCQHKEVARAYGHWCHEPKDEEEISRYNEEKSAMQLKFSDPFFKKIKNLIVEKLALKYGQTQINFWESTGKINFIIEEFYSKIKPLMN